MNYGVGTFRIGIYLGFEADFGFKKCLVNTFKSLKRPKLVGDGFFGCVGGNVSGNISGLALRVIGVRRQFHADAKHRTRGACQGHNEFGL